MTRVICNFQFLQSSRYFEGEVQVIEVTEAGLPHIYMRMRVGKSWIRLPRAGLSEIIEALQQANERASSEYKKLLRRMNQAIGRMSEWSDPQKARARGDAEKYFDGAPAPSAKKTTKKKKKVAKKKVAKAAAKKVTRKKKTQKNSPILRQQARNKRAAKKKAAKAPASAQMDFSSVQQANLKVGTIDQALQSMRTAKELGASETDVALGAKKAQQALTQIVDDLCGTVGQSHLSESEQDAAENFAKAAATGAGSNGQDQIKPSSPGTTSTPPTDPSLSAET